MVHYIPGSNKDELKKELILNLQALYFLNTNNSLELFVIISVIDWILNSNKILVFIFSETK